MKAKVVLVGILAVVLFTLTTACFASDYKRGTDDNPVRILAYAVHPVGMAAEYVVTRPIHWITKQIHLNKVFGSKNKFDDVSFKWE